MNACSQTKATVTYSRESDAAVTALRCSSGLLEVVVDELSTGSLDDAPPVGGCVVGSALAESDTLSHCCFLRIRGQR